MAGRLQQAWLSWAPPWLKGPNGSRFFEAWGRVLDMGTQRLLEGIRAAQPLRCDVSALPMLSKDRGIKLYPTEPLASQRYRLSRWKQLRATKGSPYGVINHVRPYFLPGAMPTIRLVWQSGDGAKATWVTIDGAGNMRWEVATPSNWNWDGQTSKFARWWLVIYLPPGFVGNQFSWAGTPWDSGPLWDGIPLAVIADLWQLAYDWKSAGDWFAGLIVTALQPTDLVPGQAVHPFDPASTSTTNADHSTNLPTGNWGSPVYTSGPYVGLGSRAPWALFYNINNG